MRIHYIEKDNKKLFSFHRHDFQAFDTGKFIDGGWDYIRTNTNIRTGDIADLISDIREQFHWTANYNKDGTRREVPMRKLLKDLDTDHIIAILIYFTEALNEEQQMTNGWKGTHMIFLEELRYRNEQKEHQ